MAVDDEPQPHDPAPLPEPAGARRWQDLPGRQRTMFFFAYAVAYAGPSFIWVSADDFKWYETLGFFGPWLVLSSAVRRFQPRLSEFVPGCFGVMLLLVPSLAAGIAGMILFGKDLESFWGRVSVAAATALLAAWFTCEMYRAAGEKALEASRKALRKALDDPRRRLLVSRWVNENPEAAWDALNDRQKSAFGGQGWKKIEIKFRALAEDSPRRRGPETRVDIRFFALGGAAASPTWYLPVTIEEEENGSRHLSLKDRDGFEHEVEYQFKHGKLQLKGSYLSRDANDSSEIRVVLDGEYTAAQI